MGDLGNLAQQPERLEFRDDFLPRVKTVQPLIFRRRVFIDFRIGIQNIDQLQIMAASDFKIIEVMGRGNLHRTCTLFGVGIIIGNNRNFTPDKRQGHGFADQILIAFIFGVNGNGAITQHGFGAGRADLDKFRRIICQRIFQIPHMPLFLQHADFQIGDGGVQLRIPVYKALILVDQTFFIQLDKHLFHGIGQPVIHRKALALPVGGGTKTAQLRGDGIAGLFFPFPDFLKEFLAPQLLTFNTFLVQFTLDNHLRCDTGMVGARLPQRVIAAHTAVTRQNILQGHGQSMAHMQTAGDIRRRHRNGIGRAVAIHIRRKHTAVFPAFVMFIFNGFRFECFIQHCFFRPHYLVFLPLIRYEICPIFLA